MSDIQLYDFNDPKDFERLCKDAAKGCYYPPKDQRQYAMSLIIQNLVLPRNIEAFDVAALQGFIRVRLQTAMAARTIMRGK